MDADRTEALNSPADKERIARCGCGGLNAKLRGEPVEVYVCSCQTCQQRSGSAFTYAALFPEQAASVTGERRIWRRHAESGRWIDYNFCPTCGITVVFRGEGLPGMIGIPVGCLTDPDFSKPRRAYWTSRRHHWLEWPADIPQIETQ